MIRIKRFAIERAVYFIYLFLKILEEEFPRKCY